MHKLNSTDTDSEKSSDTSSASKTESKSSSSAASSKSQGSAASSKAASSKTSSSKAAVTQPTTTVITNNGGNNGNNGNTTATNSQNTVTNIVEPDPDPVQSTPQQTQPIVSYYEPEPTPQPTPEPQPEPTPEPEPEQPVIDSPYARPFDVETIRNDMIAYGQECGLILDESLNIDNAAWFSPINTRWYDNSTDDADIFVKNCHEDIDSLIEFFAYEGTSPDRVLFNVQIVEIPEYPGEYRIYVPYG